MVHTNLKHKSKLPSCKQICLKVWHNKSFCFSICAGSGRSTSFMDLALQFGAPLAACSNAMRSWPASPMETTFAMGDEASPQPPTIWPKKLAISSSKARHFHWNGDVTPSCSYCVRADKILTP